MLVLQNAFLTIILRYSRTSTAPDRAYSPAAAVLYSEILKCAISIIIALRTIDAELAPSQIWTEKGFNTTNRPLGSRLLRCLLTSRLSKLSQHIFSPDSYKLAIPAILYVIQNNLHYVAATNLDVATLQVCNQMKILTTAFFSVVLLRKRLSQRQWIGLTLLAIGVGIVQLQSMAVPAASPATASFGDATFAAPALNADTTAPYGMHRLHGFVAILLACVTSGLAGVYFEYILKSSSGTSTPPDLWIRNVQLSAFSIIPACAPILFGGHEYADVGWVAGVTRKCSNFGFWAVGTVVMQTLGGLVTAIAIKHSDNIMCVSPVKFCTMKASSPAGKDLRRPCQSLYPSWHPSRYFRIR